MIPDIGPLIKFLLVTSLIGAACALVLIVEAVIWLFQHVRLA